MDCLLEGGGHGNLIVLYTDSVWCHYRMGFNECEGVSLVGL